ncbi:MAG: GNAT family N-acetyltransferase [Bacillota bacterium]
MENYQFKEFTIEFYDEAYSLWDNLEGISLSQADSPEGIKTFLIRNPGLSFVALDNNKLIGTVLCGHDGRRGYLHHLAVDKSYQRQGIGRKLAEASLNALHKSGIQKCHLFVVSENYQAQKFWERIGWIKRDDIIIMSFNIAGK